MHTFNGKGVALIFIAEPAVIRQWLLDFLSELHSCSLGWCLLLLITSDVNFLVSPCGLGAAEYSFDTIRACHNCYMWQCKTTLCMWYAGSTLPKYESDANIPHVNYWAP